MQGRDDSVDPIPRGFCVPLNMASDSWIHCLCPFPAHQGSQIPIQSLTPARPQTQVTPALAAAATAQTSGLQCVFTIYSDRFLLLPQHKTTQDIISSCTPVSLPWTPPEWVYDGTLASSTQHLLVACRMKDEERKASHFQKPEKSAFLSPLGQKLGWPHIPSRSNWINRP